MALIYCRECGKQISDQALSCPHCGCTLARPAEVDPNKSDKDWLTCVLLSFFLGGLGIHSFYVGKNTVGVVQLITLGGCGIWALIDFIMIVCGSYRDADGKLITHK
ncbi:MAG: TM2 domain-containing protein [Alistipes sp.]|nr:TM2 domain-containing protein [Alistipes sp.]